MTNARTRRKRVRRPVSPATVYAASFPWNKGMKESIDKRLDGKRRSIVGRRTRAVGEE